MNVNTLSFIYSTINTDTKQRFFLQYEYIRKQKVLHLYFQSNESKTEYIKLIYLKFIIICKYVITVFLRHL